MLIQLLLIVWIVWILTEELDLDHHGSLLLPFNRRRRRRRLKMKQQK